MKTKEPQELTIEILKKQLRDHQDPPVTLTIDQVFENTPEGDFSWKQDDPGDAFVELCAEKDCPYGAHKYYVSVDIERKNGKRTITRETGDEDGNWQPSDVWEEGEDPTEILEVLGHQLDEYFKGWATYDLACAETRLDLLTEYDQRDREEALQSARENINYLFMKR